MSGRGRTERTPGDPSDPRAAAEFRGMALRLLLFTLVLVSACNSSSPTMATSLFAVATPDLSQFVSRRTSSLDARLNPTVWRVLAGPANNPAQPPPQLASQMEDPLNLFQAPCRCFRVPEEPSERTGIIKCRSPEMETFSCFWSTDDLPVTPPETIELLFSRRSRQNESEEWKKCPVYISENNCFFNKNYTSIWVSYCLKLVSGNLMYDEYCFDVDDIVILDPPIELNWTVLGTNPSRRLTDILVTWKAPLAANVGHGWISPTYQLQYKEVNKSRWKVMEPNSVSRLPLYALKTCRDYEIRIQSCGVSQIFGEFSEVLYVSFGSTGLVPCEEEFQTPWPLVMAFGTFGLMVMLSLVFFSKKQKLKILILPPVPVPKIKGVDPDLLKKGKLDEVNSILASHGNYMPPLCGNDSWVEFIELDIDEAEDRIEGSDTDRLLGDNDLKSHSCLAVRDDDSGRASCCEPDIPETNFSLSDTCDGTSDIGQSKKTNDKDEDLMCLDQKDNENPMLSLENTHQPLENPAKDMPPKIHGSAMGNTKIISQSIQSQLSNQSSVANTDLYTQVSNITLAGSVVLSPGKKIVIERTQNAGQKEPAFQYQPSCAMDSAYSCEMDMKKCVTVMPPKEIEPDVQDQGISEGAAFATGSLTTSAVNRARAMTEKEESGSSDMLVADYTSIHIVQSSEGFMLSATALPVPDKEFTVSCGYVSTDQLNKILP